MRSVIDGTGEPDPHPSSSFSSESQPSSFPEPLRSRVLKGRTIEGGLSCFEGRPGAQMEPYDFQSSRAKLEDKYSADKVTDYDVISHALYPAVFDEFKEREAEYGKVNLFALQCRVHYKTDIALVLAAQLS